MKYLSGILITILALFSFQPGVIAAEPIKIGIVDLQRCIIESNEGKRIQEGLQKTQQRMQEELSKKQNEINEMQKEMEKQSLMLSMDAKEDKQKELEKKQRDFGYFYQDKNEELKKAENDARTEILQVLMKVVESIAKRDKFDLITEKMGTGVLYVTPVLDITDEVIKELNKLKP